MRSTIVSLALVSLTATGWSQSSKLFASDATAGDNFGVAVAIHGTRAVVGAQLANGGGGPESGAAYIFDLTTGTQVTKLNSPIGSQGARMGHSVAISAEHVLAGALFADGVHSNSGMAYLFNAHTGALIVRLQAPDPTAEDFFGAAVALDNRYAVVGAASNEENGTEAGAAYVYDAVTGLVHYKLIPSSGTDYMRFGCSVAVRNNIIAVGAYGADSAVNTNTGAVYLFNATTGVELLK